jgi:hypothetical protein
MMDNSLGSSPKSFVWNGGELKFSMPGKNVVLFKLTGNLEEGEEENLIKMTDLAIDQLGPIHLFLDWEGMNSYSSKSRKRLTEYTQRKKTQLLSIHALFQSKFVALGITVANAVLKNSVTSYSDRGKFEAALKKHLA